MPKENKHARGRRGQDKEKRKREEEEQQEVDYSAKRQKPLDLGNLQFVREGNPEAETDNVEPWRPEVSQDEGTERPFYGMLSEEEQEYFRHADELLELNNFPSDEERSMFLANVYKEANGKELKIANSQSCSRLMERLILLSTAEQKKTLFQKFSGNFYHLIQHRFASHCCETLFIQSAPIVTREYTEGPMEGSTSKPGAEDEIIVSMENLFLYTLNELEGHLGYLITDKFASHTLRVLLAVLSGKDLDNTSTKNLLQSKRKEQIEVAGIQANVDQPSLGSRAVPESFQFATDKIISDISSSLDSTMIHALATHPSGNPALQMLAALELTRTGGKNALSDENSVVHKLLPDEIEAENSQSVTFINGLMYEPIGSRLLETILNFAPGKLFKKIYHHIIKDRVGSLARNEIAGYVVIRVLKRLSPENLEEAVTSILPQIQGLVERSRTTIIKALFECCYDRKIYASLRALTQAVAEAYGSDPSTLILKMTHTNPDVPSNQNTDTAAQEPRQDPNSIHGSLLAQTMLLIPGPPTKLIQESLLSLSPPTIQYLACTTTTSHILQTALKPTQDPSPNVSFRRKFTNIILSASPSMIVPLATSKAGSHVIDALFAGTQGLMVLKERICGELAEAMPALKENYVARAVLRNWMVELFVRWRAEWVKRVKEGENVADLDKAEGQGKKYQNEGHKNKGGGRIDSVRSGKDVNKKSSIDLARKKFAATQGAGSRTSRKV